ncbi:MAG: hypothetical protein K8T91_15420 [Planctomycetes bacterium]|nr:hypothetical protein [Planctomycetota bacterium]
MADWLDGAELPALYSNYSFVDQRKRELTTIRDQIVACQSTLADANPTITCLAADCYRLELGKEKRSCEVSFWGKNECPDARFSWDECQLFEFQSADTTHLAAVASRWISDQAMPSSMRQEFPDLKIGELADYYENGNPIEGEFVISWNSMEHFYDDMNHSWVPLAKAFIAEMRKQRYDRKLRAGQSLWSLILSRSRRHGLEEGQAAVQFWFSDRGMSVRHSFEGASSEPQPAPI